MGALLQCPSFLAGFGPLSSPRSLEGCQRAIGLELAGSSRVCIAASAVVPLVGGIGSISGICIQCNK